MSNLLIYLFQVSVCQAVFYVMYHYLLSRLSFFQANRAFLLLSTAISFVIPALSIEFWQIQRAEYSIMQPILEVSGLSESSQQPYLSSIAHSEIHLLSFITIILFVIYLAGGLFHLVRLMIGVKRVLSIVKNHKAEASQGFQVIRINSGPSFFAFWKYIFINNLKQELSKQELQQVIDHEKVHVQQRHTIDMLFMELAIVICWFNPFIKKLKNDLCQVHEFIADSQVISNRVNAHEYAQLILRLSSGNNSLPLIHQFSKINIKNRITMLNNSNNNKMKISRFFLAIPVVGLLMMAFSFVDKPGQTQVRVGDPDQEFLIGEITWKGNSRYSDAMLNKISGLKKGDIYNERLVQESLNYNPKRDDISSLYMDNGHLFFSVTFQEEVIEKTVNLQFDVYEGETASVGQIIINGNREVPTSKIMEMIDINEGDIFSRSKLIQSQMEISKSGLFVPDSVQIRPIPHESGKRVDFEYVVKEL